MSKKVLGIEIGSDTVKLTLVSDGKLLGAAITRMPDNLVLEGRVTSAPAMVEVIRDLCKRLGVRPGACALVLPPNDVIIRNITMPLMPEKELLLNLPYEFKDFVGKEASKFHYDYVVTGTTETSMDLYAVAVPQEVLDSYVSILTKAGMKVKAIMPTEMAWLNLVRTAKNLPQSVCIVDIGHRSTRVTVFIDGKFAMVRSIDMAGHNLTEAIGREQQVDVHVARSHKETNLDNCLVCSAANDFYSALAVEIMRTVMYYKTNFKTSPKLDDIFFCGGSAKNENLRAAILKQNNLVMHHIQRLVTTDMENEDLILTCALAAGAAMQVK